jgi:hypothetical protein
MSAPGRSQALIPEPFRGEGTPVSELALPMAAGSAGAAAAQSTPRRAARWPLILLPALVVIGAAALALLAWIAQDLALWTAPAHLLIDGDEILSGFNGQDLPPAHRVVLAAVLLMACLAALVIVPLAVMLVLLSVAAAVLLAVGLPMLLVLCGLALLLSPLLLLSWLVWKTVT